MTALSLDDDCNLRCEACGRVFCTYAEESPGEDDGHCAGCWLAGEDG